MSWLFCSSETFEHFKSSKPSKQSAWAAQLEDTLNFFLFLFLMITEFKDVEAMLLAEKFLN